MFRWKDLSFIVDAVFVMRRTARGLPVVQQMLYEGGGGHVIRLV